MSFFSIGIFEDFWSKLGALNLVIDQSDRDIINTITSFLNHKLPGRQNVALHGDVVFHVYL